MKILIVDDSITKEQLIGVLEGMQVQEQPSIFELRLYPHETMPYFPMREKKRRRGQRNAHRRSNGNHW